jgi:hypothetical protein
MIDAETREAFDRVKAAIARINDAKLKDLEARNDPTADSDDRGAAREAFRDAERQFGNQWRNVERILGYMDRIVCSYCGHETPLDGLSSEQRNTAVLDHIIVCEKRPELKFVDVGLAAEGARESFLSGDMEAHGKAMAELGAALDKLKAPKVQLAGPCAHEWVVSADNLNDVYCKKCCAEYGKGRTSAPPLYSGRPTATKGGEENRGGGGVTDRALDALIAEKVMGWKHLRSRVTGFTFFMSPDNFNSEYMKAQDLEETISGDEDNASHFSKDISAAMHVQAEMHRRGWWMRLEMAATDETSQAYFGRHDPWDAYATASSPAQAICLAALKAVGVEVAG